MIRIAAVLALSFLCSADGAERADTRAAVADTADSAASDSLTLTEWTVPWPDTRPRDPYVANDGRVWFVGQVGDYLAWLDPESGEFRRFDLPAGTGPHNLIVAGDGGVWYAGNRAAHIGRLDPETGAIEQVRMPDPAAADPHTLVWGPEGDIWFTVQNGNFVGKVEHGTRTVRLVRVPTPNARPYGIVVDPQGRPWFVEFGSNKIGTVDPATMELRELELPRAAARPRRLALTTDGAIWYVDYAEGYLGRLDPATGEAREWRTPGGARSLPYAIMSDDRDRLWLSETGPRPNHLVGFDPASETFIEQRPVPSSGTAIRHMFFHGPDRTLWFGTDGNTVVRARLP